MNNSLYYFDPNHGGCLRIMHKMNNNDFIINGAYGSDEGKKGYWCASAKKVEEFEYKGETYNLIVDFKQKSIKTHKNIFYANMKSRKIHWQDGNTWIQMYA